MTLKEAFFSDLARHLQTWRDGLVAAVADPSTASTWAETMPSIERLHQKISSQEDLNDLQKVLDESLRGILHSTLVTIDGGSSASEVGNLALVDAATNEPLTTGALHEEFVDYLADRGMI
jgi:hypothetical protein